jgi:tetratricopeptide (TPR) repeat protein
MGEIPCTGRCRTHPIRIQYSLAAALLLLISLNAYAEQSTAPPNPVSPSNLAQPNERKTLSLDTMPAEKKAELLMARGEYEAAIAAFQQGNLKSALVWNSIGMAYHHMYALEQARRAYQQSLALNPRFAAASNNLAAIYYAQHEFKVAEHFYKKALKHSTESAVIYCNLGTDYFAQQKYKKGVKMYQKAFAIDESVFAPERAAMVEGGGSREQRMAINYYIAQTFAKAGNQQKALIFLRKAMDEGFKDRKRLDEDQDFAVLRNTPEFQQLLNQENLY